MQTHKGDNPVLFCFFVFFSTVKTDLDVVDIVFFGLYISAIIILSPMLL